MKIYLYFLIIEQQIACQLFGIAKVAIALSLMRTHRQFVWEGDFLIKSDLQSANVLCCKAELVVRRDGLVKFVTNHWGRTFQ